MLRRLLYFNTSWWHITGADRPTGFPEGGGGVKTFTSTHTPWTLSAWRRPPSRKLKNTPTLGHSQAPPPPPGHCPYDVIHIPRGGGGGGDRSRSRTHTLLYRLFYQYHTITKNLKYALVMKHQIYRLKVDGANLGIVGIVRPKLLSARLTQTIIRRRHSSCSGLTPALGKPCSLLDRLYFLFFRNI